MAKSVAELKALRAGLISRITADDLVWNTVPLRGGLTVEVCRPVLCDGYYVPVTAGELWEMARRFRVFPLTRAVADQAHNAARVVKAHTQDPVKSIYDFELASIHHKEPANYGDGRATDAVSGAHKLWILAHGSSPRTNPVNYGLYVPRGYPRAEDGGKYLDRKYQVIQSPGRRHNFAHWDYSQLIQLMRNLGRAPGASAPAPGLRQALGAGHPAVWDESNPPLKDDEFPW